VPDTTREVWIVEKFGIGGQQYIFPDDYIAWYNADGWFSYSTRDRFKRPPVLWHEIELPEIPDALIKSSQAGWPP